MLRLLSRDISIKGSDDIVQYAEYVAEVTHHANCDNVLEALQKVVDIVFVIRAIASSCKACILMLEDKKI